MTHHRCKILAGLLVAMTAGCGSGSGNEKPTGGSGGSGGSASSGNGGGGSTTGGGGGAGTGTSGGGSGSSSSNSDGGDGQFVCVPGIPATTQFPRMTDLQYNNVVHDLLGVTTLATANNQLPSDLLYADFDGPMIADAWRLYQNTAATIAAEVMGNATEKANFISCDPSASGCLQQTIQTFGRKAFRRPLTTEEVTRFMNLANTTPAGQPSDIAQTTLEAFLQSPSFLYLPELTTTADPSGTGIDLSSYEVATRLSFMLWGSVPDATLSTAADNNQLQTSAQILTQAQRMIGVQAETGPLIAAFHHDWLQWNNASQHWFQMDHDSTQFPNYVTADRTVFQEEEDQVFENVAFNNGSMKDLFTTNVGFVNSATAAIYGLDPTQYGTDLTSVQLDSNQRPGFLTRAAFLSSYSDYSNSSPILRGAFIEVYLVGNNPGPPSTQALSTPLPSGAQYTTNRERFEALANSGPSCQACHSTIINPPGYTMENYNAIGQWQTVDALGGQIDASANVIFSATDTHLVNTPLQLMQGIIATPATQATYAQYWVSYAYGRAPNDQDQCEVNTLDANLSKSGYSILNLLADLTQTDSFRTRVQATP
jgi:hypothetical protein